MQQQRKSTLSWAFYDWGNSAFATTVMAGFFPIFFKEFWSDGVDATTSTFRLGAANALGSIIVAAMAPILGAIADRGGSRKRFLAFFAFMGVIMTGGLFFIAQGAWFYAAALYVIALIGFSGGNIFYDSLIVYVSEPDTVDVVSALGYALGYLGGGLLFALNVWMVKSPATFGLADAGSAVRISFLLVALWWAVFTIPVLLFVKEDKGSSTGQGSVIGQGFRQLASTFKQLRGERRQAFIFLIAYWLYIDGVDTVIRMAVDYGLSLGFDASSLIVALLITQFVGFPAAIVMGKVGQKFGTRKTLYVCIGAYILITVWGSLMTHKLEFYGLAIAIGLVQGGVQALSRAYYTRLIPAEQSGEFFGFYNMLGKFAAIFGPLIMGGIGVLTGEPRLGIASIVVLFIAGGAILTQVNEDEIQMAS